MLAVQIDKAENIFTVRCGPVGYANTVICGMNIGNIVMSGVPRP